MTKPAAPHARRSPGQSFHPTHYLRVFYKRRWVAIPGFLLVFLSGAIDSVRTVPIYQASAQLMIEKSARRATSDHRRARGARRVVRRRVPADAAQDPAEPHAGGTGRARRATRASGRSTCRRHQVSRSASAGCSTRRAPAITRLMASTAEPPPTPVADHAGSRSRARPVGRGERVPGRTHDRADSRLEPRRNQVPVARIPNTPAWAANEVANQYKLYTLESRLAASKEAEQLAERAVEGTAGARWTRPTARCSSTRKRTTPRRSDDRQNIVVQKLTAIQTQVVDARFELVGKQAAYQQYLALQQRGQAARLAARDRRRTSRSRRSRPICRRCGTNTRS